MNTTPDAWRWRRIDGELRNDWLYWYPGDPAHHDPRRFIGERDDIEVQEVYTRPTNEATQEEDYKVTGIETADHLLDMADRSVTHHLSLGDADRTMLRKVANDIVAHTDNNKEN